MEQDVDVAPAAEVHAAAKPKRFIAIAAAAIALLGTAGAGTAYYINGSRHAAGGPEGRSASVLNPVFVDVPPVVVNISDPESRSRLLKVRITLAVPDQETADRVTKNMPMMVDPMLGFLRELRPEDLAGSQALFRIKEELLLRATQVLGAGKVHDILVQELVLQ